MKRKYIVFIIFLGFVALVVHPVLVFTVGEVGGNQDEISELNTKISDKKNKIKELEDAIEAVRNKITKKRTEAVSLSNQISILDNRNIQVELDIEATKAKLDTLNLEIERLEISIEKKEFDISKQKKILAEFIRTIHQQEGKDFIEIIAAYDDFSDFYSRIQYLEAIEQDIARTTKSLRIAKVELQEKKEGTETRKGVYVSLNEDLEAKKSDLDEQAFLKSNLLAQTHASELQFSALQNSLKKKAKEIENEITGIEQEVRRKLESENKLTSGSFDDSGLMLWPAPSKYITAYFHDPDYPYRHVFEHSGLDIRAGQGTALRAAASGYVARARRCSASTCYSYLVLVHNGGLSTVYGHLSKLLVSEDQFVAKGDVVALSGGTPGTVGAGPFVTGPHLHFEVRKNGIPVNPLGYLAQ